MRHFLTAFMALAFLSACATAPEPEPAEICSAQWIQPRAERAMKDFKKDTKPIFKKLKSAGKTYAKGETPGPFEMLSLMNALSKLGKSFENGQAMKDMRTLAATCDDPDLIKTAMTDFMRDQGISEKFIAALNGMEAYVKMLDAEPQGNGGI